MAKASYWDGSDGEERRSGERTGLDTPVVLTVNHAGQIWRFLRGAAESNRRG
jgi:hypothetical protein